MSGPRRTESRASRRLKRKNETDKVGAATTKKTKNSSTAPKQGPKSYTGSAVEQRQNVGSTIKSNKGLNDQEMHTLHSFKEKVNRSSTDIEAIESTTSQPMKHIGRSSSKEHKDERESNEEDENNEEKEN